MRTSSHHRTGLVNMWVVIVLALLTALGAATSWQYMMARRVLQERAKHLQAEWLARSGIELAAGRLLAHPDDYRCESLELIPGGRVEIEVNPSTEAPDVFEVNVAAYFPTDGSSREIVRTLQRSFVRTADEKRIRIEPKR